MAIEYTPPGLKGLLNLPNSEKRFRNKEGYAHDGNDGRWAVEGLLLDVHSVL